MYETHWNKISSLLYFSVRGDAKIKHIDTEDKVADIFKNPLETRVFYLFIFNINGWREKMSLFTTGYWETRTEGVFWEDHSKGLMYNFIRRVKKRQLGHIKNTVQMVHEHLKVNAYDYNLFKLKFIMEWLVEFIKMFIYHSKFIILILRILIIVERTKKGNLYPSRKLLIFKIKNHHRNLYSLLSLSIFYKFRIFV